MEEDSTSYVEILEKFKVMSKDTFWDYVGCEFTSFDGKRAVISLQIKPHHLNLIGILHGGVHAMLIDSVMGVVCGASKPNERLVTTHLNVQYVAPVKEGTVTVTAEILHMSRKTITTQAFARNDAGELCAFGTGSFRIIDRDK